MRMARAVKGEADERMGRTLLEIFREKKIVSWKDVMRVRKAESVFEG